MFSAILVLSGTFLRCVYIAVGTTTTSGSNLTGDFYETFESELLSEDAKNRWMSGTMCSGRNRSYPAIFCPMPFEPDDYSACCDNLEIPRCCQPEDSVNHGIRWAIALGVVIGSLIILSTSICLFNKCMGMCQKQDPEASPRAKVKVNANKREIRPVDKRTLLKTANYTVEQSWDQVMIKFHNREFYERFTDALLSRYKDLRWKDPRREKAGQVTSNKGQDVGLRLLEDARSLIVTMEGNSSWVMNDFQNICKNVRVSDATALEFAGLKPAIFRSLAPRLPTIGEEFYDAGDHYVKISQTEVEVKFLKESNFECFKKVLYGRYPTVPWSKYLQRDCAHIQLQNGKAVTVHIWEDIRSVWFSGNGKRDWYNKEFQEIYADVLRGNLPEQYTIVRKTSRPQSSASRKPMERSFSNGSAKSLPLGVPANYTVKTLDTGGFEIEFPNEEFVTRLREAFEAAHPGAEWQEYSYRKVTKLELSQGKSVTVQLGSSTIGSNARKIWIYDDPGCKIWFNGEFKELYVSAYEALHHIEDASSPPIGSDNDSVVPVETMM